MVVLMPRLPGPVAETIVRDFLDHGPDTWLGYNPLNLPNAVRYAATGGTRINVTQMNALRLGLDTLARKYGFGTRSDRDSLAKFDAETAEWLAMEPILDSGESLRDDVWSFMGAVLAPDIAYWRFGTSLERYVGGVRNTFQRLWMRGRALDRGVAIGQRWQLLHELTEDAFVQIMERPSIGGDPILSIACGEAWLRAAKHHGRAAMQPLMRRAMLRIRILNEVRSLANLPEQQLSRLLDELLCIPSNH